MIKIPYIKEALKNIFLPPVTEKYPEVPSDIHKGYRGKIKFNAEKCTGCGICIEMCSPRAIIKKMDRINKDDMETIIFDLTSCTFCGMCGDFCPKDAIEFTEEYSMVTMNKKDLMEKGSFKK